MLADSGLLQDLQRCANSPAGNPFCLYGDLAYPQRIYLLTPLRNTALTDPMIAFNKSTSTVRESIKWLFNDGVNYFKFMAFKNNLKISLSNERCMSFVQFSGIDISWY